MISTAGWPFSSRMATKMLLSERVFGELPYSSPGLSASSMYGAIAGSVAKYLS